MSSDSDTRVVIAKMGTGTSFVANGSAVYQTSGWSKTFDTHGMVDTSNGRMYVPVSGYYRVTAFAYMTTVGSNAIICAKRNGGGDTFISGSISSGGGDRHSGSFDLGFLSAGDYIQVGMYAGSSTTIAFIEFSLARETGPSQVAASETVAAHYTLTSSQALATNAIIPFNSTIFDSHNAFSSNSFVAPSSGYYRVGSKAVTTATSFPAIYVYVNGVQTILMFSTTAFNIVEVGTTLVKLKAGDVVSLRIGTAATIYGSSGIDATDFTIHRIN